MDSEGGALTDHGETIVCADGEGVWWEVADWAETLGKKRSRRAFVEERERV